MSVKLTERAVDAVLALLKSKLPTEIGNANSAAGDGVVLAVPTAEGYHDFPSPGAIGQTVHIDVYESAVEFDNPYTDIADARAVYDVPLTVRAIYFNRDLDAMTTMARRGRRYAAALFNTFVNNHTLNDSDEATKLVEVDSYTPNFGQDEVETGVFRGSVSVGITVRCEETQA